MLDECWVKRRNRLTEVLGYFLIARGENKIPNRGLNYRHKLARQKLIENRTKNAITPTPFIYLISFQFQHHLICLDLIWFIDSRLVPLYHYLERCYSSTPDERFFRRSWDLGSNGKLFQKKK